MARIAGVNVSDNKHTEIALTAVFGIGRITAQKICATVGVNKSTKIKDLNESEIEKIRNEIDKFMVEGDLRREVQLNIRRLGDIGSYRGSRHKNGLPANGQRTKTNARTRKGKKRTIGLGKGG